MRNIGKIICGIAAAALAFALGALAMAALQPAFEARTFNKFRARGRAEGDLLGRPVGGPAGHERMI